ncbi:hypothetical protein GALL_549170 [mine drainage metagenome]|uniref:Uncharacterized protein n=1 Tax=mine drainage metagenome TaxID=410659 RepID=A0A1J5NXN1_9ZZZZ
MRRQSHDRGPPVLKTLDLADRPGRLVPVHLRHLAIHQHQIELVLPVGANRFQAVARRGHPAAQRFEQRLGHPHIRRIVFHQKDRDRTPAAAFQRRLEVPAGGRYENRRRTGTGRSRTRTHRTRTHRTGINHYRPQRGFDAHRGGRRLRHAIRPNRRCLHGNRLAAIQRHGKPERRSHAHDTFDANIAVHHDAKLARDRQPQTGAAVTAGHRTVHLIERFENHRLFVGRNPNSAVGNLEPDADGFADFLFRHPAHDDRPLGGELQRVADQIGQYLQQPVLVADQH